MSSKYGVLAMEDILIGIGKLTFWLFRPIFKGIAWIFTSIFKAIGRAIGNLIKDKGKEVAPKVATAVGVGAVTAGATVVAEEVEKAKAKKKTSQIQSAPSGKKAVSKNQSAIVRQEVRVYKNVAEDDMNFEQMKSLLGAKDDSYVEEALKYWKSLEDADLQDYLKFRQSSWLE